MKFKVPDKIKEFFKGLLKKDKLILILLVGVLLLIITIPVKKTCTSGKSDEYNITTDLTQSYSDGYVKALEDSLVRVLSETAGVGKTEVAITVKNSGESILYVQKNTSTSKVTENDSAGGSRVSEEENVEESVIYTDDGAQPFVVDGKMPEIQGVIVVAEGAGDINVVVDITDAVSALLGISINKIKVLKMEA